MVRKKALFLDRDGVINEDTHFVHKAEDCRFMPGIFELCAAAQEAGYLIIITTNQSGIGRGLFTEADFICFTDWMQAQFALKGIHITQTYFCPHHPEEGQGEYKTDCSHRKPGPGMILKAAREHDIDLAQSIFIGDRETDMEAAKAAGIGKKILLKPVPINTLADHIIHTISADLLS